MTIWHSLANARAKAETFQKDIETQHQYIYQACTFIIHHGEKYALECGVDALGALVGDPLLFEEIELIYFGLKIAAHISYKLYHYLKSKKELHGLQIERMHHHEIGYAESEEVYGDNDYGNNEYAQADY